MVFTCAGLCLAAVFGLAVARRGPAVFIARPAARRRPRVRGCGGAIGRFAPEIAGATWASRTTSAPWGGRGGHTTVFDARTGAIYLIGGGQQDVRDVWASTDGGARAGLSRWFLGTGGTRCTRGTKRYSGVLAARGRPRDRVAFGAHRRGCRAWAAGVSWASRTTSAEWAARAYHTSVIDAAGTIYVIGGRYNENTRYNDVWASTDGGTRGRTRTWGGWVEGGTQGYLCVR
jgi:hypothetical protein